MASGLSIVEATQRHLLSGQNRELNRLNGALTSGATAVILEFDLGGVQPGTTVAIDDEEMHVFSVVASTKTATVQRGMNGSTAAAHSDDALVHVKPIFSRFRIVEAVNDELRDLSSPVNGLFQIKTLNLTYNAAQQGYNLTSLTNADVLDIYEVRYQTPGPSDSWPRVRMYDLARHMDTTEFASGLALILHEAAFPGNPIRVRYKAPFAAITSATADVATTSGLADSALDILSLGAAIRLQSPRDVKRSFTEHQGDTRRADEVPVGGGLIGMRGLAALRIQRIQAEAARLQSQYPTIQGS